MGKSRPYITNLVRLLTLPDFILNEVEAGKLSQAHARLLIQLPVKEQKNLLNRIQKEDLSVRQVEHLLKEEKIREKQRKRSLYQRRRRKFEKIVGIRCPNRPSKKRGRKNNYLFS